jgi:hypothetical protein
MATGTEKPKVAPPVFEGVSSNAVWRVVADVGHAVNWGTGPKGALERTRSLTAQEAVTIVGNVGRQKIVEVSSWLWRVVMSWDTDLIKTPTHAYRFLLLQHLLELNRIQPGFHVGGDGGTGGSTPCLS